MRFAESILPVMEQLHSYVWRRHIAALAGRALAATPDELVSNVLVVGFADVVGYPRLARDLSETELAGLIERFESMAAEVIATAAGRLVKTLGDEVLFVAADPVAAAAIGLGLLDSIDIDDELPDLRIGIARGNVLSRFGDVYGPVVNIASRLTSAAKPGTVLVDRELATALASEPGLRLRRRRAMSVRGYTTCRHGGSAGPLPAGPSRHQRECIDAVEAADIACLPSCREWPLDRCRPARPFRADRRCHRANSGIWLVSAPELARVGAHVVLAVRDQERGQTAAASITGSTEIRRLDLADLASVRAFAQAWDGDVDVLINNAGVMMIPERRTVDGFELQLATNHLGHFVLTNLR